MTPEQIREVVRIALDELEQRQLIKKPSYQNILPNVEDELTNYFYPQNATDKKRKIGHILRELYDDPYIDVILLHYRDKKPLGFISECMDRDITTIKRNKKRLIFRIYELLND